MFSKSGTALLSAAALAAIVAMAAGPGAAQASLVAYEGFNYPSGTNLSVAATTGSGFAGNWALGDNPSYTTSMSVTSGSLSYSNLVTSNNKATGATSYAVVTENLASPFNTAAGTTTWYSLLLQTPASSYGTGGNFPYA